MQQPKSLKEERVSIYLSGASGRMGRAISDLLKTNTGFNQHMHAAHNEEDNFNIIIDFSVPKNTLKVLEEAKAKNIPIVIGTTGFTAAQKKEIENASLKIPVFFCSNMSVTFHIFKANAVSFAKALPLSYDVEIVDMHHRNKRDAPSGTAKILFKAISGVRNSKALEQQRFERDKAKGLNEIGISCIRSGEDFVGEHRIVFANKYDRIELMHRSSSQKVYAQGALEAARWLIDKEPGLYGMRNIMNSQN